MSKNTYGNKYPGSGTVRPCFAYDEPEKDESPRRLRSTRRTTKEMDERRLKLRAEAMGLRY